MGGVLQTLVTGVGVNGGHDAVLNAELVVQDLGQRSQAVGGAGSVGDDVVLRIVVVAVVDAHDEGAVNVLAGSGDDDLLGAGLDVGLSLGSIGEQTGGLDGDVNAEILPREVLRVTLAEDLDLLAVDGDGVLVVADLSGETAQDGVVLQEVGQGLGVGEVVDGDDLEVSALILESAEEVAANAAESIDTNLDGH